MGETRVDLIHLLEDLRDAYPGALEETILTEMVANALDSGAGSIRIVADPGLMTLTVTDDGHGMQRRELARFHDVAASTKTRGEGIGFAGVGIKLGLLVSEEVLTETRRGKTHVSTRWHLASRHRAPWKWVTPAGTVGERGTAVSLKLRNALSPLLDPGFIENTVRRHYHPMFDPAFEPVLAPHYPRGVRVDVNGRVLEKHPRDSGEVEPLEVRLLRKRKPSALGYLVRDATPLAKEQSGIGISTRGKVIKRGWEWLGITPAAPDQVGGLVEAPALAACLTLNKADFIRVGQRGSMYLAYRKCIQEAVARQLAVWGDARDASAEARRRVARPLERDLERVLMDLAEDFPLLTTLIDRHEGGQRRLPMARSGKAGDARALVACSLAGIGEHDEGAVGEPETLAQESPAPGGGETAEGRQSTPPSSRSLLPGAPGPRRPGRLGLGIQFEERPDDPELGHLVESTVWVNTSHAAYRRAVASRSEGYHVALAAALAIAPLAAEPAGEHAFVTAFLACWGEAVDGRRRRRLSRSVP